MKEIVDINTCFSNTIVGLSTVIFSFLESPLMIDEIYELCNDEYKKNKLDIIISYDDVIDSILLLFMINKIKIFDDGRVGKLYEIK